MLRFLTEIHPHLTPRQKKLNKGYLRKMKFGAQQLQDREFLPDISQRRGLVATDLTNYRQGELTKINENEQLGTDMRQKVIRARQGPMWRWQEMVLGIPHREGVRRNFTKKQIMHKAFKFIFEEIPVDNRSDYYHLLNIERNQNKHNLHKFLILRSLCRVALYHYIDNLGIAVLDPITTFQTSVKTNFIDPFGVERVNYTTGTQYVSTTKWTAPYSREKDSFYEEDQVAKISQIKDDGTLKVERTTARTDDIVRDKAGGWKDYVPIDMHFFDNTDDITSDDQKKRLNGIIIRNLLVLLDFFHDFYGKRGTFDRDDYLTINNFITYLFPAEDTFYHLIAPEVGLGDAAMAHGTADNVTLYFRDLTHSTAPLYRAEFIAQEEAALTRESFPVLLRDFIVFFTKHRWSVSKLKLTGWDAATKDMMSYLMTIMHAFDGTTVERFLERQLNGKGYFMFSSDVAEHRFDLLFKNHQSKAYSPGSLLDPNGSTLGNLRDLAPITTPGGVYFHKKDLNEVQS